MQLTTPSGTTKPVGVLSTDMSKAFDAMHPTLLLAKLKAYGFSEGALSLMRSLFKKRKGRTKLGTVVSEWKEIKMGYAKDPIWAGYSGIFFTRMTSFT